MDTAQKAATPNVTPDIIGMITNLHQRLVQLRETGLAELKTRFEEQAATFGLTADAVINGVTKTKRRGRPRKTAINTTETPEE